MNMTENRVLSDRYMALCRMMAALVLAATMFLWSIEFGVRQYDVGLNVYLALLALPVFLPFIWRNRHPAPVVFCTVLICYQIVETLLGGMDVRSWMMCAVLLAYFIAVYYALVLCDPAGIGFLRNLLVGFLILQLVLQVLELFGIYELHPGWLAKHYFFYAAIPTGLFTEASHLGFSIVPLLFWKEGGQRINPVTVLAALCVFLGISVTGVVGLAGLAILTFLPMRTPRRAIVTIGAVVVAICVVGLFMKYVPTAMGMAVLRRLYGVVSALQGDVSPRINLSSLVFVNGLDMAMTGIGDILGAGIGRLAVYFPDAVASKVIEHIAHQPLNMDDGGSVVFKMIGEMGVVGLLIMLFFLGNCVRILQGFAGSHYAVFAGFLLIAVLRSAGYFHGPFILSLAVVCLLIARGQLALPLGRGRTA